MLLTSRVEVNVEVGKRAVQVRGGEAEFIHRLYHRWLAQALQGHQAALLVDLHGHGHPHQLVELGYRVSGHTLNQISRPVTRR